MGATARVVVEFPNMHELIDHAGIGLEIADEILVMAALLQGRKTQFLIQLHGLRHLANMKRISAHFVQGHDWFPRVNAGLSTIRLFGRDLYARAPGYKTR